jgi:hypothetical protein
MPVAGGGMSVSFAILAQHDYPAVFCILKIESAALDRPAAL